MDSALPYPHAITPQTALRRAWVIWLILLAAPFLLFLFMIWRIMLAGPMPATNESLAARWFIAMIVYHVLVVPGAIFLRARLFRPWFQGRCIAPRAYVAGMLLVWIALELGGLLSLAGCIVSRSLLPNMLPAMLSFVIFIAMWPTGRALVCEHKGDSDDPEKYEEPR